MDESPEATASASHLTVSSGGDVLHHRPSTTAASPTSAQKRKKSQTLRQSPSHASHSPTTSKTRLSTRRVVFVGVALLAVGTTGFYAVPGLLLPGAAGNPWVNAFYCAVMTLTTVGYGDICPGEMTLAGKVFLVVFTLGGVGMFGLVCEVASQWRHQVPGGFSTLMSVTIGIGSLLFTSLEGMSQSDAVYTSVMTGMTVGYGDMGPLTDLGKIAVALYAILVVNVFGGFLEPARRRLEQYCRVRGEEDRVSLRKRSLNVPAAQLPHVE